MMTRDQALIWAEALESGKFTQWFSALHDQVGQRHRLPTAFCCLGVAQVALFPDIDMSTMSIDDVCAWLGFNEEMKQRFVDMNDKYQMNFAAIAAQIRANLHWFPIE